MPAKAFRILPSNRESFGLAKKLGFREEGVQRKALRCGYGELDDVRFLAIVREEWLSTAQRRCGESKQGLANGGKAMGAG